MKTTNVILVAVLMAFATIGFSQNEVILNSDKPAPEIGVSITVQSAMRNPGLLRVMRDQLNPKFLLLNDQQLYTVTVIYNNVVYKISGTYNAWRYFFSIKIYQGTIEG